MIWLGNGRDEIKRVSDMELTPAILPHTLLWKMPSITEKRMGVSIKCMILL